MKGATDVKGTPVQIDSRVQGFHGFTQKSGFARVYAISEFGWVAAIEEGTGKQTIMYPGRFLVRDGPRALKARQAANDVPERLRYNW